MGMQRDQLINAVQVSAECGMNIPLSKTQARFSPYPLIIT